MKRRAGITTWQQEIAWREFYQQAMYHFPSLAQGAYREPFKHFPWVNDETQFQAWCEGKTGYPIVDARHAPTQPNWLDAQSLSDDRREFSHQGFDYRLAMGRAIFYATPDRWRFICQ